MLESPQKHVLNSEIPTIQMYYNSYIKNHKYYRSRSMAISYASDVLNLRKLNCNYSSIITGISHKIGRISRKNATKGIIVKFNSMQWKVL